ncbi:serine/threonine-protein kinase [Euzebya sp.]|uniref:serine/threonine-protein kinase n=1 Tax=Euzebya sp. TaxID=1971409 RepID=UPI00351763BE
MADPRTSHVLPGYTVLGQIGVGGTATVHRARHDASGTDVAIKVLTAPPADERAQKQFSRETSALAALGWHPNVVVLHEVGTTGRGHPFIAMELLAGGSLDGRVPLPHDAATALAVSVAGALDAAHSQGVLHRDVKPANILLDAAGMPKLADFGISGIVDATHTSGMGMTLNHVAPEVVDGGTATVRSDVYSLASTLYELLAGEPPFTVPQSAALVTLLLKILDSPAPDLRDHGVPADLAAVVADGLAKDPAQRPASARDLGRRLQLVQSAHRWATTPMALPSRSASAPGPTDPGTLPMDALPDIR